MGLTLRVLSGPHRGAEFEIPAEAVIIGTADACDVVIDDDAVADRHAELQLEGDHIKLTPLEGNVFIAGKLLREPSDVENFTFITLGNTHLMVGESESKRWADVEQQPFPELEKIELPSEVGDKEGLKTSESDVAGKELENRDINAADGIGPGAKIHYTLKQRMIRYSIGVSISAALAVAISIGYVMVKDRPPVRVVKLEPLEKRIERVIRDLKLNARTKVTATGEDGYSVVGYTQTLDDSAKVKKAVRDITEKASVKLSCAEKVLNQIREAVQDAKQNVVVKQGDEFGDYIALGYVKKGGAWAALREEIEKIKGVNKLDDQVLNKDSAEELAENLIKQYKMEQILEVKADDAGVAVTGTIADDLKGTWSQLKGDLERNFKKKAQLSFNVGVSTDRNLTIEKFFGGKIDSVNFNDSGLDWVNLKNGNKYFQGSVLPSGYVVETIEQDSVTIKNAEEEIKLDLEWM